MKTSTVLLIATAITGCRAVPANEPFREPPVVASRAGVLQVSLTPAPSMVTVGGHRAMVEAYNGLYIPPTLRVHPGDTLRLRLTNALAEPTNLHTHGLTVPPRGNADNVLLTVAPGQTQDYEIRLPADHPPGLYWYHPHPHELSDMQVRNGMSGAIIVDGLLDPFPTLRHLRDRVLLLKDLQIENGRVVHGDIGKNTIRTINGIVNPVIVLRPGETELWRIGNIGADLYYSLTLDGHHFHEVGRDGNRLARLVPKRQLLLEPGAREEVLVQAAGPGTYALRTARFSTGPQGNHYPGAVLATLHVAGAALTPMALPDKLLPVADLRGAVTGRRTIVFSETEDGDTLFIDGRTFDPGRTDTRVKLGAVEEWTIRNPSGGSYTTATSCRTRTRG